MRRMRDALAGAIAIAMLLSQAHAALASDDSVLVEVDRAKLVRLDQPAATVIVGNPAIADALVQSTEMLVVTGKSFGVTNMIVLDSAGATIADMTVFVRGDDEGIVTVQRGPTRLSFTCEPVCQRTLVLGDTNDDYDVLNTQIQKRIGLAEGQAAAN